MGGSTVSLAEKANVAIKKFSRLSSNCDFKFYIRLTFSTKRKKTSNFAMI